MLQHQELSRTDQTADKILRVLVTLEASGEPWSAKQLALALGYPVSSIYRYLGVLKDWQLVMDDPFSEGFQVGARALTLAHAFQQQFDLGKRCLGLMQRLMEQTQETVLLLIPAVHQVVCVESVECVRPLRYSFQRGVVIPSPLRGASVQAMLPYYPEALVQEALAREPDLDPAALLARREKIRAQGYAVSQGEVDDGVLAVAAAVLGRQGRLLGSVSLVAPAFRVSPVQQQTYIAAVRQAAQDMSALIRDGKGMAKGMNG